MTFNMSELQISLLCIGIALILAVYGYSWYQQRQYRRKFGTAFETRQEDALYRLATGKSKSFPEESATAGPSYGLPSGPAAQPLPGEGAQHAPHEGLHTQPADGVCDLLNDATDYIAVLSLKSPASAHALAPLWQQRFDFGKNVYACGLNAATGKWEKAIAESHAAYATFKLAMQLADRSGAASEVRLSDFRDLARLIATQMDAKAELPDVAAASVRALELDSFCAEVDQMTGLNIMPSGERTFSGGEIARVAGQHDMSLQADGAFHLLDAQGYTVFSLGNYDNTPFQHHTLPQIWVNGLTLLLDVPRVERPTERFEQMAVLARQLAMDLHAAVVDDHRVALGEPGIAQIREQIAAIESRMLFGKVTPGSAQARRLFA